MTIFSYDTFKFLCAVMVLMLFSSQFETYAVTDADLEALEKQIEMEEKRQEDEKKAEQEQKIQAEKKAKAAEKRRIEEQKRKKKLEEEAARQAELEKQLQEQEEKLRAEEQKRKAEEQRRLAEEKIRQELMEKLAQEEAEKKKQAERRRQEAESTKLTAELAVKKAKEDLLAGEMVFVQGGTFTMGSSNFYTGTVDVTVPSFWIGRFEVTTDQWIQVMGNNPTKYQECARCPVTDIAWDEVKEFLNILNRKTGANFRLPTESEWEYACRSGGKEEKFCGANDINSVGWYKNNAHGKKAKGVGKKNPNGLDLYDMSGNVSEWVEDCWSSSLKGIPTDGTARTNANCNAKVVRGGSWANEASYLNASDRIQIHRTIRSPSTGFRIIKPAE